MMLGLPVSSLSGLRGIGGIQTCDMVVDGNGNAVDCSSVLNLFNSSCWNPLAPCAASGAVDGQPTTIDCSKSQLGTVGCTVLEQQGAGAGGTQIPWAWIEMGVVVLGGALVWSLLK